MADGLMPTTVSRSAFLELREEEQLVHNGYEFLDEKRVQLAAEMLRQRESYREARARFISASKEAAATLLEAAAAQGLEALQMHPATVRDDAAVSIDAHTFVGVSLINAELDTGEQLVEPAAIGVIRACVDAFMAVVEAGVPLAAISANLERLMYEYQRTERRVRALENVILPEIREELTTMEEHLDLNEQEEVIRVRQLRSNNSFGA